MSKIKDFLSKSIVRFIISVVLLYLVFTKYQVSLVDSFFLLMNSGYIYVILFLSLILNPFISGNRWKVFLKYSGIEEKLFTLIRINLISSFFGIFLPSVIGNDFVKMYLIGKKNPDKMANSGVSVIIERYIGLLIYSFLAVNGSIFLVFEGKNNALIIFAVSLIIFGFLFILPYIRKGQILIKLTKLLSKIKYFKKFIQYIIDVIIAFKDYPLKKVFAGSFLLILIFQLSVIVIIDLLFKSLGAQIHFYNHLIFVPVIYTISLIPISIGGLGLREWLYVYFYQFEGIESYISVSVSLLSFLIISVVPGILGSLIFLLSKKKNVAL